MPPEETLGILADMAFRVIRKTFDGEDAVGAARLSCDEVITPSSTPTTARYEPASLTPLVLSDLSNRLG